MDCYEISDDAYRQIQHDAVYNLSGTSMGQVQLQIAHVTLGLALLKAAISTFVPMQVGCQVAVEILGVIATLLTAFTLTDHLLLAVVAQASVLSVYAALANYGEQLPHHETVGRPRKEYLSEYRAMMMVCDSCEPKQTCPEAIYGGVLDGLQAMVVCAILAVDFQVFPREYAKTETYGTGTMDIGVGSMMLGSSMGAAGRGAARLSQAGRAALPLLVLGAGRAVSVKAAAYHEHVSEYGVHWNYFFTLGAVSMVTALIANGIGAHRLWVCGLVLLALHETLLVRGLGEYVLHAPRTGWLSANKEGVVSIVGYLSLCMLGHGLGGYLLGISTPHQYRMAVGRLLACSLAATGLVLAATHVWGQPPSRRMANAAYVGWVIGASSVALAGLVGTSMLFPPSATLRLVKAINRNQLPIFLLANVATGAVNMTLRTHCVSDYNALAIIALYMAVVFTVAVLLDSYDLTIKP